MVWSKDRCCVAVPLYNVGIYAILAQFAVIALLTGVLSFAAPYIVAVSIPSFGAYLLGGICVILFCLQGWGFFGVYKEKPASYRKYVRVNLMVLSLAFIMALVWIIVSAARHNKAVDRCILQFITEEDGTDVTGSDSAIQVSKGSTSGQTLCSIFTWVQTGVMGGLWLALLIVEFYFGMISRIYGSEQREDHKRYNSIYTEQRQSYIRNSMMWENGRLSQDGNPTVPPGFGGNGHGRTYSSVSRGSGLRNEVKFADDNLNENDLSEDLNDTSKEAFIDAPLYVTGDNSSPTKSSGAPYSHGYSGSRSNLAPVNSNPAYQQSTPTSAQTHGRNRSDMQYGQYERYDHPTAGGGGHGAGGRETEHYSDYYAR